MAQKIGRNSTLKMAEKSAGFTLPVNRILFNYAIAIPITQWIIEGRKGPKPNLWEAYEQFLRQENIKTEQDIKDCIKRYGADRYLPKISKRPKRKAKVYHLREALGSGRQSHIEPVS